MMPTPPYRSHKGRLKRFLSNKKAQRLSIRRLVHMSRNYPNCLKLTCVIGCAMVEGYYSLDHSYYS